MNFAEVYFHVPLKLPFPLILILSIDIIIPTGINVTSMWQPKRWYQCLLKDHCAFLPPLTAVALCWPRWMKKPWRLLTASNGACCKQTASGMHNNVMMQKVALGSAREVISPDYFISVKSRLCQMTQGNAALFHNLITLRPLVLPSEKVYFLYL